MEASKEAAKAARRNPIQLLKEAKQIAKDHGLRVAECPTPKGIDYVLYRILPDGRDTRLGKRSSPARIRAYVCDCAGFR